MLHQKISLKKPLWIMPEQSSNCEYEMKRLTSFLFLDTLSSNCIGKLGKSRGNSEHYLPQMSHRESL
jgi:hypothetical protein